MEKSIYCFNASSFQLQINMRCRVRVKEYIGMLRVYEKLQGALKFKEINFMCSKCGERRVERVETKKVEKFGTLHEFACHPRARTRQPIRLYNLELLEPFGTFGTFWNKLHLVIPHLEHSIGILESRIARMRDTLTPLT